MKVHLTPEFHEMTSPMMMLQIQNSIAFVLQQFGLRPAIDVDLNEKSEAERRYWEFVRKDTSG